METKKIVGVTLAALSLLIVIGVYIGTTKAPTVSTTQTPPVANEIVNIDPSAYILPANSVPLADNQNNTVDPNLLPPAPENQSMPVSQTDASIQADISSILSDMAIDNSADFGVEIGL